MMIMTLITNIVYSCIKENILDNIIQNYFNEDLKNIDNLYQKINLQNNTDIEALKKQFEYINTDYNLDEDDKKNSKIINNNKQSNNNINTNKNNENIQKENNVKEKINQLNKINQETPKKAKEEDKKKLDTINFNNNKEQSKPKKSKPEMLKIEFNPPEIETCQFTKEELEEMDIDDDYENEFLKIEEDGDDGLLLAEIIDGRCSENATFDSEQFYLDNIDDKLDIQYYEGIKFENEGEGEGLNEAIVVEANDEDNKEEVKKEEEIKKEEVKKEENVKKNNIEEIKKQLMNNIKQSNNPSQQTTGNNTQNKPSNKSTKTINTQPQNKKQEKDKDKNINIAQFIEDKTEKRKKQKKKIKLIQKKKKVK